MKKRFTNIKQDIKNTLGDLLEIIMVIRQKIEN